MWGIIHPEKSFVKHFFLLTNLLTNPVQSCINSEYEQGRSFLNQRKFCLKMNVPAFLFIERKVQNV